MRSDKQFKIKSLLRMADITQDDKKRKIYLDTAEKLLLEDSEQSTHLVTETENESVRDFYLAYHDVIQFQQVDVVYNWYLSFCKNNKLSAIDKITFCKTLYRYHPVKSEMSHTGGINRKTIRIIVKIGDEDGS